MSSFEDNNDLRVTKRDGTMEIVAFDKILNRLKKIGKENIVGVENLKINYTTLAMKVIDQLFDGIHTTQIDELSAEQCASMASTHPDYNILAGRIVVSNHHKNTKPTFSETMEALFLNQDTNGVGCQMISTMTFILSHKFAEELDAMCHYERDYLIDYFGFKTLERAYLLKINKRPIERPQHMWLRVAIGIHGENLEKVKETYDYMSQKYFTHATPTLFNSGTPHQQLSSCYLIAMENDSIDGIYNTLKDCAMISKWAGGIGMHIHNVRASGSYIRGTGGSSNGIAPMLRVFNNTAKYVDQCLTPETILYTDKGPIPIAHTISGITGVFNSDRKIEIVENVLEHVYHGKILEIYLSGRNNPMRVTPEHLIRAVSVYKKIDDIRVLYNELGSRLLQPCWVDAKDITAHDYIVHTIPDDTCVRDFPELTVEMCYLYGKMLTCIENHDESNMDEYQSSSYTNTNFYVRNTPQIIEEIQDILRKNCIAYNTDIHQTTTLLYWSKSVNLPFKTSDFWNIHSQNLHMSERWIFLPKIKIEKILEGLNECTIPPSLHSYIHFLQLRLGKTQPGELVFQNQLLVPVIDVKETVYCGLVYDLQMSTRHNYLLENGIVHNGGGKRNGSFAIYLEPWHADIEMFLQMRKNHGDEELKARDLFYALWIPDLFMERVKTDGKWTLFCPDECPGMADVYGDDFVNLYTKYETSGKGRKTILARELWFQMLDAQMETGTPYMLYKDACNRKSNQQNLGTIKSSNLCVAPETCILTDKGHIEIQTLENKVVNVWNGEEWSEVTIRKTGEDVSLIVVYTEDGTELTCTPQHTFYIQTDTANSKGDITKVEAQQLQPNDILVSCDYPVIDGNNILQNAYMHGFTCGVSEVNVVPSFDFTLKHKLQWFSGYSDSSGTIFETNRGETLRFMSHNHVFLLQVKLFLQTCGIHSIVEVSDDMHRLVVSPYWVYKLLSLGFEPIQLKFSGVIPTEDANPTIRILKVENNNRIDDTYCFTEPKKHMGVFNGILTGQCSEIVQYSDENETAVCNLASMALPMFVNMETHTFDYDKLHKVVKVVIENLDRVIDVNFYPTEKTRVSNMLHRPIGLGVQGLADVFMMLDLPFHSDEAKEMNRLIFETIYHASMETTNEISKNRYETHNTHFENHKYNRITDDLFTKEEYSKLNGTLCGAYSSFIGSPTSNGMFQFDLWNIAPTERYDWETLRTSVKKYGIRNSLLIAPMPTASTSQILGFNECIEPITSNIYSRRTMAGEFIMANKYLMNDLMRLNLWNEQIKNNIIANNGSVQQIDTIPIKIREKYKTVWEIPMRHLIDMAADRGAFICQSQSLNLWLEDPNYNTLTSMHFYSWKKGLKTGIYYLRRRGKHQAQQFTIEPEKKTQEDEHEICEMCSS